MASHHHRLAARSTDLVATSTIFHAHITTTASPPTENDFPTNRKRFHKKRREQMCVIFGYEHR